MFKFGAGAKCSGAGFLFEASLYRKPAKNTSYLHPKNDFSGLAFFSSLDGEYCEVYEYRHTSEV